MDDVSEARPLAKLQEALEEENASASIRVDGSASNTEAAKVNDVGSVKEGENKDAEGETHAPRKSLLNNVDHELDRLAKVN